MKTPTRQTPLKHPLINDKKHGKQEKNSDFLTKKRVYYLLLRVGILTNILDFRLISKNFSEFRVFSGFRLISKNFSEFSALFGFHMV